MRNWGCSIVARISKIGIEDFSLGLTLTTIFGAPLCRQFFLGLWLLFGNSQSRRGGIVSKLTLIFRAAFLSRGLTKDAGASHCWGRPIVVVVVVVVVVGKDGLIIEKEDESNAFCECCWRQSRARQK